MPSTEQLIESRPQESVDRVVETLAAPGNQSKDVAEIAHDASNMVTALNLYCDLLQQPGVLAAPFAHYGGELRLVAAASRRLIDKLIALEPARTPKASEPAFTPENPSDPLAIHRKRQLHHWKTVPSEPIRNLAQELLANRNLLASLAGPTIALTVDVEGAAVPVRMTAEDLTRILVNLVKNAAEALSAVGRIHISLRESIGESETCPWVTLNVEDNGPGLNEAALAKIFASSPSPALAENPRHDWPISHRGLGLSITRSIVENAGGTIHAANRDPVGACLQIELPVSNS
jgi:signal transduction histidine kinase